MNENTNEVSGPKAARPARPEIKFVLARAMTGRNLALDEAGVENMRERTQATRPKLIPDSGWFDAVSGYLRQQGEESLQTDMRAAEICEAVRRMSQRD